MNLIWKRSGRYLVLRIDTDKVDATNALDLKEILLDIVGAGEDKLVIDLSDVGFMDSSGLAGLLPIVKAFPPGGHLMVAGLQPRVRQLFKLTKVDTVMDIRSSVEDATGTGKLLSVPSLDYDGTIVN
ncbi:STAS domain-containing protein [Maridesulfovibrio sp.]|uniref:STAS domain-containing protein n=1 Tax=Maridesulfovibrio sp. TaxID=2795000 RepID=UPI002A186BD7|nr:STAS domain-containing protein [Maridesulfovibrio sp.]